MTVAILKHLYLVFAALALAPPLAAAQTSGDSKPERGMPAATDKMPAKSERVMPTQPKPADTPLAKNERAMAPDKK